MSDKTQENPEAPELSDLQDEDESYITLPARIKVPLINGLTAGETKRVFMASVLNASQDVQELEYEVDGNIVKTKIIIN